MKLLGKKALVTGAARGIGRGCALELARAGADVAVNDRERSAAEPVAAEIRALGRQAAVVEGDVFARPSCERVVEAALAVASEVLGRELAVLDVQKHAVGGRGLVACYVELRAPGDAPVHGAGLDADPDVAALYAVLGAVNRLAAVNDANAGTASPRQRAAAVV